MGPLFVLVSWWIIATAFGLVGAALVWVGQYRQPRQIRRRRMAVGAALPLLLMFWLVPVYFIWRGWGALTGLHAPLEVGDSRDSVELPNGYAFVFVDASKGGVIYPPDSGPAAVSAITALAVQGTVVFGFTDSGRFVFDTSGQGATPDLELLRSRTPLKRARDFPGRPSYLIDDLLWYVLWLVPPFLVARRWWTGHTRTAGHPAEG